MKKSIFNVFFPYENKTIGYNTLYHTCIILENELYQIFDMISDLRELQIYCEDFYNELLNSKFIVDKNLNELEIVKKLVAKIDSSDELFHITINPTMNCNFKCWYCYETHIKSSKMSNQTIDKIEKLIDRVFENDNTKNLHISWFGGEPLLKFENTMIPILESAKNKCLLKDKKLSCSITTNGYLISDNHIAYLRKYNFKSFQITLDGGETEHNNVRYISKKKGSFLKILENIKLLVENDFRVVLRINVSHYTFENIDDILCKLDLIDKNKSKKSLTIATHKVWQNSSEIDDTRIESLNDYIRNKGYHVLYNYFDGVRNSCYADKKNHVTINYDGNLFKCTARDFKKENNEGILNDDGTIEWNDKYYKRINAKFSNPPCLECKILPICNGSCSQHYMESDNKEFCVYDFDEEKKINQVRQMFLEKINN